MSEFFSSRNLEDIKHLRNFVFMGKNETIRTNIISLQNEFLYKISFYLINGIYITKCFIFLRVFSIVPRNTNNRLTSLK